MNKKHLSSCLVIVILLILASFPAVSQKVLATIVKNGEIRIGTSGNQPPYSMKSKTGELMGFEIDLANALATNMGVKPKLIVMPFSELMDALRSGKIDAIMSGMTITPERNLLALFAGPYNISGKSILTKSSRVAAFNADTVASGKKYKIVCLKGSTSEEFVKTVMSKQELIAVDNYNDGVNMVINDQADAMVADKPICVLSIMRYPGKDLVTTEQPLTIEPIGMALPPGDPQFLNLVTNYLSTLQISGTLAALEKKWFNDGSWML
ncbi:MAG TPA: transporter substrate-binding domain-containing protein, partial [Puia sp.]|nr:transporter substrate-binding domain-containing protein [Puia sp.]